MSTESLIIELDAKTQKAEAELKSLSKRLDELDGGVEEVDNSLLTMGKHVVDFGKKAATAFLAVSAAVEAMVLMSSKQRKELEQLSKQAKISTDEFQSLSFATSQYGIDAEQIADISKDVSDKVGEFSAAGTGAFQDYADVLKLTKEEARETAVEFQDLTSEQVLGRMVSEMEKAGVAGDQVTFVLESMGNDLSKLQPLFANNSKELSKLKDRFKEVNDELQITDIQAEKLKEVSTAYDLMTKQIGNASTAISATLAPVMDDFFNDVISVVPTATQTIIDFVNSFLAAENITSISAVDKQIQESQARLLELESERRDIAAQDTSYRKDSGATNVVMLKQLDAAIESEKKRTAELNLQLEIIKEQQLKLDDANTGDGGQIGGITGSALPSAGIGTGDEISAIEKRFKTDEQLLIDKLDSELAIIGDNKELRMQLEEEFLNNMISLEEDAEARSRKIKEDSEKESLKRSANAAKQEAKIETMKANFASRTAQTLLSSSLSTQQKLFSVVKDATAGQIEAYGLTAGAKALAELGPIAGPPVSAKYIGWSQVAAGVVRALPLGGGGGGGGTPDGSTQSIQQPAQEDQQSPVDLTIQDDEGIREQRIIISTEDGENLVDFITNKQNERGRTGR